ncbi:nuclear transport factor 2 family protein [Streptacidiphilus jiangxiensis]|uniref:SnoaL-like domain-containing protein n=1 Tax=Streptacidiphilus jiangxiensis TaxID=235985 RepID=A0A1H7P735_STRJI|nr:nuclear transport factor 2 family protein [Streptacidiphilus jiangxiensis]SEL31218.1 SnoaL-like domain-containing protein [Streptacidiphilus jiangxiensis]
MKSLGWKTIVTATALAGLSSLAVTAGTSQAAGPAGGAAHVRPAAGTEAPAALTPAQLAALPLTNRHLTRHEIDNLAVVLGAYHDAEGASLNVDDFVNRFTDDGVFNDMVAGQSYRGQALGDVLTNMASIFPDVHRDLRSITVSGDEVSLELAIQGTFEGPAPTPAGTLKPNGARIDVPTADFWYLKDGKITKFDCFVGYTDMYAQMGVNLDWAGAVAKG